MDVREAGRLAALLYLAAAWGAPFVQAQPALGEQELGVELHYEAFTGCPERDAFVKNLKARRRGAAGGTVFGTIQRRLCGQFPLIPKWQLGKYGLVYVDTTDPRPVGKLRVGRNLLRRIGRLTEVPMEQVANKWEVVYQYDAYINKYRAYKG